MSGYDHLLPNISSMHHLMHDVFGPPDNFGTSGASARAADRERSAADQERSYLAGLAEADIALDAEPDLESTLERLAAIQLRASGAVAGHAAGLEVVGKPAPVLNAQEEVDLAISRLSKIKARAAVAVETAARVNTEQAAELDTASLKAHLVELRRLKREVEEEYAPPASDLIESIEKLERLSSRAHSASFEGKGLEIRGVAIPSNQRSFHYDADATEGLEVRGVPIPSYRRSVGYHGNATETGAPSSWEEEYDDNDAYERGLYPGRKFNVASEEDSGGEELLLQTLNSQGSLLNAVGAKIAGMQSAVTMGTVGRNPRASSSDGSDEAAASPFLMPVHLPYDARLTAAGKDYVHAQVNDLVNTDLANLPFLLRLLHGVEKMCGPMASRQRTALLQLVLQVVEAGDASEGPQWAEAQPAMSAFEEEQADDICDDRYEDDLFAEDAEEDDEEDGEEAEDGQRGARGWFDTFAEEDVTPDDAGGYPGQRDDDRVLDAQEVTERVHAMALGASLSEISALCSQLGLPGSGTREQLLSRLVSHLQTEMEIAELDVYYEEEESREDESAGPLLPPWPTTRQSGQASAPFAEDPDSPSHQAPADPAPSGEAARPGTSAGGKRPRAFSSLSSLAGSNLKVHVSGPDFGASFRSDDSDRPKTARGQPGVDPFHYVSPTKVRPTSAPHVRSAADRAVMMPMPIQRLTISAATPPACSPLGSPFDPAIASADEAFAVEDEEDEDDLADMAARTST